MTAQIEFCSRAFLTLFVIMDPVGLVPIFVSLAGKRPAAEQRRIALRAVVVAGGLLAAFAVVGRPLLQKLGITLDALRVAGGLLLFRIAVDMVTAHIERETPDEEAEALAKRDISVFPLAIPLIAGPGAMASVLLLAGQAGEASLGVALVLSMAAAVLVIAYVFLVLAPRVSELLGRTGVNVVTRVLGVLLAALAVQYVADGVRQLLRLG